MPRGSWRACSHACAAATVSEYALQAWPLLQRGSHCGTQTRCHWLSRQAFMHAYANDPLSAEQPDPRNEAPLDQDHNCCETSQMPRRRSPPPQSSHEHPRVNPPCESTVALYRKAALLTQGLRPAASAPAEGAAVRHSFCAALFESSTSFWICSGMIAYPEAQ